MQVLVIGDMHIPNEAEELPEKFRERAKDSDLVICTGDITDGKLLDELMESTNVRVVRGEEDYLELPEQDLVKVEDMKFGVLHGHQVEEEMKDREEEEKTGEEEDEEKDRMERFVELAELLKADVLITGHTHKPFRTEKDGKVLLNPGSATGVDAKSKTCMLLEVEGTELKGLEILTSE